LLPFSLCQCPLSLSLSLSLSLPLPTIQSRSTTAPLLSRCAIRTAAALFLSSRVYAMLATRWCVQCVRKYSAVHVEVQ
jgi:hypothetical protein